MSSNKTNIKIVWTDAHKKNYGRLYNKLIDTQPAFFKNKDKETYLNTINKKEIINFIKKMELSDSSKESLFL